MAKRFQQELIHNRIVTNLDQKIMLSTFIDHQDQWIMIIIEVFQLWIDIRIGKNSMSQRFYIPAPSFESELEREIIFGYRNYSGCVRQIEISYSQAYSILLTDQLVELNENRTLGLRKVKSRSFRSMLIFSFFIERMLVRKLFVERMNSVKIIGSIIHVNVNLHILVFDVIKVKSYIHIHFR